MVERDLNLFFCSDFDPFDEMDHYTAVQLLNILVFPKLRKPVLLSGQAGIHLVPISDQSGNGLVCITDFLVAVCLEYPT